MTAAERYQELTDDVNNKLKLLKKEVAQHNKRQKTYPKNWGYVGDIAHVADRLDELLEFFKHESE